MKYSSWYTIRLPLVIHLSLFHLLASQETFYRTLDVGDCYQLSSTGFSVFTFNATLGQLYSPHPIACSCKVTSGCQAGVSYFESEPDCILSMQERFNCQIAPKSTPKQDKGEVAQQLAYEVLGAISSLNGGQSGWEQIVGDVQNVIIQEKTDKASNSGSKVSKILDYVMKSAEEIITPPIDTTGSVEKFPSENSAVHASRIPTAKPVVDQRANVGLPSDTQPFVQSYAYDGLKDMMESIIEGSEADNDKVSLITQDSARSATEPAAPSSPKSIPTWSGLLDKLRQSKAKKEKKDEKKDKKDEKKDKQKKSLRQSGVN